MNHTEWITHIMDYKVKYPLTYPKTGLSGPYVIEDIYKETNGDAIIVTEVGQHQMWAAQYYKYTKPRTLLTSDLLIDQEGGRSMLLVCKSPGISL